MCPLSKEDLMPAPGQQELLVRHSISRARRLGHAVLHAVHFGTSPVDTILEHEGGRLLCMGKVW